jgi:hypothetical protein
MLERNVAPPASSFAGIWSVPGDLYACNFLIATSASEEFGSFY